MYAPRRRDEARSLNRRPRRLMASTGSLDDWWERQPTSCHGAIWLDLADDDWCAVRVDTTGWVVVSDPPVRFRRRRGSLPLPEPVSGGSIEQLRPFINVASQDDWIMIVSFLIASLRDVGPFPVLEFAGEAGSAKSTACRVIRSLIDPASSPLRPPDLIATKPLPLNAD